MVSQTDSKNNDLMLAGHTDACGQELGGGATWASMREEWVELKSDSSHHFSHAKSSQSITHEIELLRACREGMSCCC